MTSGELQRGGRGVLPAPAKVGGLPAPHACRDRPSVTGLSGWIWPSGSGLRGDGVRWPSRRSPCPDARAFPQRRATPRLASPAGPPPPAIHTQIRPLPLPPTSRELRRRFPNIPNAAPSGLAGSRAGRAPGPRRPAAPREWQGPLQAQPGRPQAPRPSARVGPRRGGPLGREGAPSPHTRRPGCRGPAAPAARRPPEGAPAPGGRADPLPSLALPSGVRRGWSLARAGASRGLSFL